MTRAAQVTQAVSAMRKARAAPSSSPEPASMTFLIYEDDGGGYQWTIVADGRETLVRSASFGSYEEAKQAARIVHRGASRASFEDRSGDTPPVDLPRAAISLPRRARGGWMRAAAWTRSRWLDEGGSFSREAVTR